MSVQTWEFKHIIYADDDEDDKFFFSEVISRISASIRLTFAGNGQELLEGVKRTSPDLVFLDLNMPLKNGLECIVEIRSNQCTRSLPIIIYSTSVNQKNIDDCYMAGANCYIVKPYTCEEMLHVLTHVLSMEWSKDLRLNKDQFVITT